MSSPVNFIKVEDRKTGKIVGMVVVDSGSEIESIIVNEMLDKGIVPKKATEYEFTSFKGDVIEKVRGAVFCHFSTPPCHEK